MKYEFNGLKSPLCGGLFNPLFSPFERSPCRVAGGGAAAFDPTTMGSRLAFFWEAANASGIGQTSAGPSAVADLDPVGYIGDKSSHGRNLTQATSAKRIKVNTDGSGRRYFYFDGTKTISLDTADIDLSAHTKLTVFFAGFVDATDAVYKVPFYRRPAGGAGSLAMLVIAAAGSARIAGATGQVDTANVVVGTSVDLFHVEFDAAQTRLNKRARACKNGTVWPVTKYSGTEPQTAGNLGTGPFRFGDWGGVNFSWEGGIYAMLGVTGDLSDEDYDNIADYFASVAGTETGISTERLVFSHANDWSAEDSNLAPNAYAYSTLYYDTTATSVDVSYYCHGIISGYVSLGVYVDGVYYSQITPSGSGAATATVSLPPGSKRVGIVNSAMSGNTAGNYATGTQVAGVTFNAPADKYQYPSTGRVLVYGDSVSTGGHASPLIQNAWVMLLRGMTSTDISLYGESGRAFKTDYDNTGTARSTFVNIVQGYNPAVLWMAMGVNDYGQANWTASAFGTAYAATLDALHAALPSLQIYAQSPLNLLFGLVPNALGDTLQDYRDAIQTACTGRAWVTYVDGSTIITDTVTELTDGVHPNNAGNATYAAFVKAELGL